jgi:hypothetical protein
MAKSAIRASSLILALVLFIIPTLSFCAQKDSGHGWSMVLIDSSSHAWGELRTIGDIAIGPGRNDGHNRLYCSQIDGLLVEYTYDRRAGSWRKALIGRRRGRNYSGEIVTIGNGRSDEVNRLYLMGYKELYEFSYDQSRRSWLVNLVDTTHDYMWCGVIGRGRNDSTSRLYLNDYSKNVHEWTYSGGHWSISQVDTDWYIESIGMGRNDNVFRLYGSNDDSLKLYEVSRSGNSWTKSDIYSYTPADSNINPWIGGVVVANGRGDGINRVYASGNDGRIYELTWVNNAWAGKAMDPFGWAYTPSPINFGQVRRDDVIRGYFTGAEDIDTSYLHECQFKRDSLKWVENTGPWATGYNGWLIVGDARGDGVDRVIIDTFDGKIYEISYLP